MPRFDLDYLAFVKELSRSFSEIGAMVPSSRFLGRAMIRPIREHHRHSTRPLSILEAGPGTGPFTRQILKYMGPEDRLVICEINPRFMRRLQRQLERNPYFHRNRERVEFFRGPVQELPQKLILDKFDVIVSSLPFTNFQPELVQEILQAYESMLAEGGKVTMVEYVGLRQVSVLFGDHERRERIRGVQDVMDDWYCRVNASGQVRQEVSFLNIPPAYTIELRY